MTIRPIANLYIITLSPKKENQQLLWFSHYVPTQSNDVSCRYIGLIAFIGIRFLSNRAVEIEDDKLFI